MEIISVSICVLILAFIFSSFLYERYSFCKSFFHDVLHWHEPNGTIYLSGINLMSKCKYCNKDIIQDSQGNWF